MKTNLTFLLCCFALVSHQVLAEDQKGRWKNTLPALGGETNSSVQSGFCKKRAMNLGFLTSHPGQNKKENGKRLNRVNPGTGVVCEPNKHWYVDANYIRENSHRGEMLTVGIGLQTSVKFGTLSVIAGGGLLVMEYEAAGKRRPLGPGTNLWAGVDREGWRWRPVVVVFPDMNRKDHRLGVAAASFFMQYRF